MKPRVLFGWIIALATIAGASAAQASMLTPDPTVLLSQSVFVQGADPSVMAIPVPEAGQVFVTLTDLDFPTTFESLKFGVTDTTSAMIGLSNPGTLTLTLTAPTTLYAEVFPTQAPGNPGLYNVTATMMVPSSPVPLPASGALLGGALCALSLARVLQRRRLRRDLGSRHAGNCNNVMA